MPESVEPVCVATTMHVCGGTTAVSYACIHIACVAEQRHDHESALDVESVGCLSQRAAGRGSEVGNHARSGGGFSVPDCGPGRRNIDKGSAIGLGVLEDRLPLLRDDRVGGEANGSVTPWVCVECHRWFEGVCA